MSKGKTCSLGTAFTRFSHKDVPNDSSTLKIYDFLAIFCIKSGAFMVFLSISAFSNIYSSIFERQVGKMFRKIVDAIKGPPGEGALSHRKNPPVGSCVIIQTEDGEHKATVITWRGKIAFQAQRGRIYFTAKILEVIPTEAQGNETRSFVKSVRRDQQLDLGKKDR